MDTAQAVLDSGQKRLGRPPGKQHDAVVHVRVPKPALVALKELARLEGTTVAEIMRSGLMASLAQAIQDLVKVAENPDRCPRWRVNAMRRLRLIARAGLHLGPHGLELARARVAEDGKCLQIDPSLCPRPEGEGIAQVHTISGANRSEPARL